MQLNRISRLPGKALLSSRFRYADRRLFFGRARLYPDRIVFSGLAWRGPHRRTVLLDDVVHLKWWTGDHHAVNFALFLRDETAVKVWIKGSGLWKYSVEAYLGRRTSLRGDLPGQLTSASAA